ncbi:MAG: NUDIX domain-containing protein [Candidatus Woesebacteria bacterium]
MCIILEQENKVLLIRHYSTGYRDGEYTLPAGHVDPNETFLTTCVREAKEEVCVDIDRKDLKLVHTMQRHEKELDYVDYYFLVQKWQGEPKIGEPHKCNDLKWINKNEVKNHAIHFISKALEHVLEDVLFSHDGIE